MIAILAGAGGGAGNTKTNWESVSARGEARQSKATHHTSTERVSRCIRRSSQHGDLFINIQRIYIDESIGS